jgi:hypothetical protein
MEIVWAVSMGTLYKIMERVCRMSRLIQTAISLHQQVASLVNIISTCQQVYAIPYHHYVMDTISQTGSVLIVFKDIHFLTALVLLQEVLVNHNLLLNRQSSNLLNQFNYRMYPATLTVLILDQTVVPSALRASL